MDELSEKIKAKRDDVEAMISKDYEDDEDLDDEELDGDEDDVEIRLLATDDE